MLHAGTGAKKDVERKDFSSKAHSTRPQDLRSERQASIYLGVLLSVMNMPTTQLPTFLTLISDTKRRNRCSVKLHDRFGLAIGAEHRQL